ncbi:collagen alpha-1(I) chain-like [Ammospiza nelsoni]|uniref:collagen alpha-1(I) chain-like n=1 Tax=Ammospiza nelsoni TaxID=2857394 RepID=UPI002869A56D|nr:collagen alpha-1(I) chain-like [Ammospiza nelsoni]
MSRAPPRGGDSALGSSLFARRRKPKAWPPRARARADGRLASGERDGRTDGRTEKRRETGEPHPGDENRKGRATRQRRPRTGGTGRAAARDGLRGGERGVRRRPRRPETAATEREEEEEEEEEGRRREEGVRTPCPRRSRLARARQHGTVPPRYPPADSRPHGGGKAGGEARASPPFSPFSLALSLSSPFSRPSAALSTPSLALPRPPPPHPRRGPGEDELRPSGSLRERGATERSPSLHLGGRRPCAATATTTTTATTTRAGPQARGSGPPRETLPSPNRLTAFPPGTGGTPPPPPPPPPPAAGNGPARRPQPRRRGGPRTAIDRQATLRQATRGRAPGFDRTSTRAKRKGKKRSEKPTLRRTAKRRGSPRPRPPPPARGDAGLTCRPSEAAQAPGLGPASARRATRRAPGTRGARRPARSRFHGTTRAQHTHWGRAAGGAAVGPRARRLPFGPLAAGLAAARRRAAGAAGSLSFPGGLTPLETARDDDRAAGAPSPPAGPLPPGGPADGERAPPPAPEADATETRAGVASARGLPDGQAPPSPGPHSRDRRRRVAPPRPLASARARRKAYGAEPGGNARSPRFHAETGRGKRPRGRPHAFLRPTRGREGRRRTRRAGPGPGPPPATAGALRPTVPAGGGHPSSGAAAARHGVARARGPPPTEGPPDARPPGGRAIEPGGGRRPADGAAGAFEEEGRRGERGRTRGTRRRARERPRQRAEERARRTPAAATPRPRKGRERALSAGVARYDEASGSAPAADRAAAASPPRPGRGEGGAGRPSPARRGYPRALRAAGTTTTTTTTTEGARPAAADTTAGARRE